MDWQKLAGDVLSQVTGNKQGEEGGANQLLSLAQSALAAYQGQGDKTQLLGQLIGTIGGDNVKQILSQLGIDPAVAENPESASEEDLQKIADHIGQGGDATENPDSEEAAADTSDAQPEAQADDNVSAEDQPEAEQQPENSDEAAEDQQDEENK